MRVPFAQSVMSLGLLVVLTASMARAQDAADRPTSLPDIDPPIKDITPAELAELPELPEVTAPAREGGLYGSAEYLLMTPRQSGLSYALVDPKNDLVPQGPLQSVTYDQSSAVRVGLGYQVPGSGWDVGLQYTYLHSNGNSYAAAASGGVIYPEMTRPGLTDYALSAYANARLNYNVYDLAFGKTLDIDEWTRVRIYGGLRFASIYQTLSGYYNGLLADSAFAQNRSNFDGVGPMLGTEFSWKVWGGFSLFGNASGGLIYGNVRSAAVETNNGGATIYTDITDTNRQMIPFAGVGLGASWQYRGLTVRAGYEVVNWFGLIQRPTFLDSFSEGKLLPTQNDLSLDGFFLQMSFTF